MRLTGKIVEVDSMRGSGYLYTIQADRKQWHLFDMKKRAVGDTVTIKVKKKRGGYTTTVEETK